MKIKHLLPLMFLVCLACKSKTDDQEAKFDKEKWATMIEVDYPYRKAMLKDLITNYKLKGKKGQEVSNLLGEPTRTDNGHLFYRISQERLGAFPLSTKTLVIKLAKDSTVEWVKTHG